MALLDNLQFNPLLYGGANGNLLDMIKTMGATNDAYKPAPFGLSGPADTDRLPDSAQPTSGQNTIAVGDYQMPRIGFGSPMDAMAKMPEPQAAPTAPPAPQDPGGDFGDRLLAGFQGFANSKGLLPAIANGISGFQNGNQTEAFLMKKGLDAQTARTVASNPTLLRGVLPQLFGTADRTNDIKNYEYAVKQGFTGSLADWKAQKGNGGGTEYGLTPIYGTDDQGNTVLGTLGKDGTFKKIDTGGFNVQSGVDKIDLGTRWMLRDKRTGQVVGYEPKDVAGEAEAKKSGALTAERMEALPKARSSLDNALNNMGRLKSEASAIMNDPALGRVTGWQGMLPNMPGGDAANVQARLETLKSQVGFSVLQAMRDASQTGGALGQVSNIENVLLQNNLAALDQAQSVEAFKKSLQQIIDYADSAQTRLTNAFRDTYPGQEIKSGVTGRKTSSGVGWSVE